jgi:tetratricopeptide (TPR) repeat protein
MAARVSLTLIVRNEAANLPLALASAAGLFYESLVVDTGSTDDTRAIAAWHGARLFNFRWCDDFAAARNEALRHATGDWIFSLDADDRIDEPNRAKLRGLLSTLGDQNAAYVFRVRSAGRSGRSTFVHHVRLFRNKPEIRWTYRVHEQILPALRAAGHEVHFTDIAIDHTGYTDPAHTAAKLQRNLRLLQLDHAERPDDPFVLFNLGWACDALGRYAEAIPFLRRSLELSHAGDSIVRKLFVLLANAHRRLGQPREALALCRAGRARCPDDAELACLEGDLLEHCDPQGAEVCWRSVLPTRPGGDAGPVEAFASYDEGLHGYLVRHRLAELCRRQGRQQEAESHWRAALAEFPGFAPARLGLAELALEQKRWDDLEVVLAAGGEPAERLDADVLRVRALLARGEFAAARSLLEQVIAQHPEALRPRILLSHVLLQEGADPPAAERALRDIVERDPRQAESWRNLTVHLRKQGRLAEAVAVCGSARTHQPDEPELLLLHGLLLRECADLTSAEACLLRLLETAPPAGPDRPRAWTARHNLALICRDQDRLSEAVGHWRALLTEAPHMTAARVGLGEALLALGRPDAALAEAETLQAGSATMEAALLRARVQLARKEFTAARQVLEGVLRDQPLMLLPRVLLSHVLLQEDRDPAAAEQALRDVLAVAPDDAEARYNLAILLRRQGRDGAA